MAKYYCNNMDALFHTWTSLSWVVALGKKKEVAQKYGNVPGKEN